MEAIVRARRTLCAAFKQRGYLLPKHVEHETANGVCGMINSCTSQLTMSTYDPGTGTIIPVFFEVGVQDTPLAIGIFIIERYVKMLQRAKLCHAVLVIKNKITPMAIRLLHRLTIRIEVFRLDTLQVNILEHVLVPRHEKLTAVERAKIHKRYGTSNLPIIFTHDPVVRLLGFVDGDIIKILRPDYAAGINIVYRRVVIDDSDM